MKCGRVYLPEQIGGKTGWERISDRKADSRERPQIEKRDSDQGQKTDKMGKGHLGFCFFVPINRGMQTKHLHPAVFLLRKAPSAEGSGAPLFQGA
jgi:hypothetical protein